MKIRAGDKEMEKQNQETWVAPKAGSLKRRIEYVQDGPWYMRRGTEGPEVTVSRLGRKSGAVLQKPREERAGSCVKRNCWVFRHRSAWYP